jgi:hypothetical protein
MGVAGPPRVYFTPIDVSGLSYLGVHNLTRRETGYAPNASLTGVDVKYSLTLQKSDGAVLLSQLCICTPQAP